MEKVAGYRVGSQEIIVFKGFYEAQLAIPAGFEPATRGVEIPYSQAAGSDSIANLPTARSTVDNVVDQSRDSPNLKARSITLDGG
jgi:hypothetical protein